MGETGYFRKIQDKRGTMNGHLLVMVAIVATATASLENSQLCYGSRKRLVNPFERRALMDEHGVSFVESAMRLASSLSSKLPYLDIFMIVVKIMDETGDKPSLWQQIEDNVEREIRGSITQFMHTGHFCKLAAFGKKQREYAQRFERIENTATASEKESFIRDVANHFDSVEVEMGNFDFAANADHLVFNYALFEAYLGAVTHEKMVLLMLKDLCKWLGSTSPNVIFHEDHWARKLQQKE